MAKSLFDYGNEYADPGWHKCTIQSFEHSVAPTGTEFVKFTAVTERGALVNIDFALTEKAMFRLRGFATAACMPEATMRAYNPSKQTAHKAFVGLKVQILVELEQGKDGKSYRRGNDWAEYDAVMRDPRELDPRLNRNHQADAAMASQAPVEVKTENDPDGDEIPF